MIMNRHIKWWVSVLCISFVFCDLMPTIHAQTQDSKEVIKLIEDQYMEELSKGVLEGKTIEAIFSSLDAHSRYYAKDQLNQLMKGTMTPAEQPYVGIGAEILRADSRFYFGVIKDKSPAMESGFQRGDELRAVDGTKVEGKSLAEIVSLIAGLPSSEVTLTIRRDGNILTHKLTRRWIQVEEPEALIQVEHLGNGVKYIDIDSFRQGVAAAFEHEILTSMEDGTAALILDLRDNSGGVLEEAVKMCQWIVPKGPLLQIHYKNGDPEDYQSYLEEAPFPITVLVNHNSASASEILASAVRESGAGKVVGEKTYGKGTVQKIFKLKNGDYVKLSVAYYTTRNGNAIDGIGLEPDVAISLPTHIEAFERKYKCGDVDSKVEVVEGILTYLGYDIGKPDTLYDELTMTAIRAFQQEQGLHPYGVCDLTTQKRLNIVLLETVSVAQRMLILE